MRPASARRIDIRRPSGPVTVSSQRRHTHARWVPNAAARSWLLAWCAAWAACSVRAARRRSQATLRLMCWERSSLAVTMVPVGRWTSRTALDVLLRCWPPAPDAR